jgi:hypothetical protein
MSPGYRHVQRGILPRYGESIQVRTYSSGERRISKDPPRRLLLEAFDEFGTRAAVASAFGVSREVVKRWEEKYEMEIVPRPEAGLSSAIKRRLEGDSERCRVAQWIMDEGSISVAYFKRGDYTMLIVCGSMNDYEVLGLISDILDARITSSKAPGPTTLPMSAIRVQSGRAYALLEVIGPYLAGLKAMEAKAALEFFPSSGLLRGRHTTDEFFVPIWEGFSLQVLKSWNSRRRTKMLDEEIVARSVKWVEGRVRRARRFVEPYAAETSNHG